MSVDFSPVDLGELLPFGGDHYGFGVLGRFEGGAGDGDGFFNCRGGVRKSGGRDR